MRQRTNDAQDNICSKGSLIIGRDIIMTSLCSTVAFRASVTIVCHKMEQSLLKEML